MKVSIIIVNYNRLDLTRQAIESVLMYAPDSEIILVDNNSTETGTKELSEDFPQIKMLKLTRNYGFGFANNRGTEIATGEYLFFLNNDASFIENTPKILSIFLNDNKNVGAVGPKLIYPDNRFQLSFGWAPSIINEWRTRRLQKGLSHSYEKYSRIIKARYNKIAEVDWVSGAALMVRRSIFEEVKGFDEKYFMYFEDSDICKRIKNLGYKICYFPGTTVVHQANATVKAIETINFEYRKSQLYYYKKHLSLISRMLLQLYLFIKTGNIMFEVNEK
ncbi:MAG: glycosyltransferase family 2 protein [Bacteroidota bacterium]|nr:glycosyltransferase family 2 protein [Bacteroidota bacterium]